jgi:exodeoxyribonuclease VII large subunit
MAIPARAELLSDLAQKAARLEGANTRQLTAARTGLDRAAAKLPDLPAILNAARQRLDDRTERLTLSLPNFLAAKRSRIERLTLRHPREIIFALRSRISLLGQHLNTALPALLRTGAKRLDAAGYRLTHPGNEILLRRNRVDMLRQRLTAPLPGRLREARLRLDTVAARLDSVSYERVLARGFALVTTAKGAPVTSASKITPGAALSLRFADGEVAVRAEKKTTQLDLGL